MENTITIPVSTLEWLIEMNETDRDVYRASNNEEMASWCEGKVTAYRNLLTVYAGHDYYTGN